MKLITAAAISTAVIIALGFFIISPLFYRVPNTETKQKIMLTFTITDANDNTNWCKNLAAVLEEHDVSATVFIPGKTAEQYPECVTCFSSKIDIGSQTYSNLNLTSIVDYETQLEEVQKGKQVVDTAGNLYSRIFKAPNGDTDQNIYSLLSRNDITADFSYSTQYNVYVDTQFIKYNAAVYNGAEYSANFILNLGKTGNPIIVNFNSTYSTDHISGFIETLKTGQFDFVNASELTGRNLTVRGD